MHNKPKPTFFLFVVFRGTPFARCVSVRPDTPPERIIRTFPKQIAYPQIIIFKSIQIIHAFFGGRKKLVECLIRMSDMGTSRRLLCRPLSPGEPRGLRVDFKIPSSARSTSSCGPDTSKTDDRDGTRSENSTLNAASGKFPLGARRKALGRLLPFHSFVGDDDHPFSSRADDLTRNPVIVTLSEPRRERGPSEGYPKYTKISGSPREQAGKRVIDQPRFESGRHGPDASIQYMKQSKIFRGQSDATERRRSIFRRARPLSRRTLPARAVSLGDYHKSFEAKRKRVFHPKKKIHSDPPLYLSWPPNQKTDQVLQQNTILFLVSLNINGNPFD